MRRLLIPLLLGALAACDMPPPTAPETAVPPPQRAVPELQEPSRESRSAALFYRRIEQRLLTEGLLRQDGGGPDTPYGAAELTRNFERIALFSEYVQVNGRYVAQQSRAPLRRWERPVRIQLHFGESIDQATRDADTTRIRAYVARLRRVSGHPISVVTSGGNYHVFVASLDEQAELGPEISRVEPGLSRSTVREIVSLPQSTYCAVYASSASTKPNAYVSAIALVRSEHPDLMRLSCYHEEIAQGLGLANDSPAARPSIFNDDEEFALLTRHDELLLQMLYDPRLNVGMTADKARPLVREIASELVGGPV
ncbi:MAG: DUF2927 domain-containing protein [Pseudomonadota bacterium]